MDSTGDDSQGDGRVLIGYYQRTVPIWLLDFFHVDKQYPITLSAGGYELAQLMQSKDVSSNGVISRLNAKQAVMQFEVYRDADHVYHEKDIWKCAYPGSLNDGAFLETDDDAVLCS